MRLTLRDYQRDALARSNAAEMRGVRRQMIVAATGLGKTIMFAALAEARGGRTLILAHRDELVAQAAAKVLEVWPDVSVGIVKAERNEVHAQVVVASVQTLARPQRLAALAPEGGLFGDVEPFGLVVVDEAHHAAADTYRAILSHLRAGAPAEDLPDDPEFDVDPLPAGPLLLGVTATPDRGDGRGLDDLFDEVVATYDILWGIRSGYLSDLRGLRVTLDGLDLDDVKVTRGDYQAAAAGRALHDAGSAAAVVKAWHEHALDRPTLVFTPTVAQAEEHAATFIAAGVPAACVSAGTPLEDRRLILRAFAEGRIRVLCNCAVLTEGYDEPSVSCVVVARPTKSRALYAQMVGRGTRRHPDKADCLVLDVVGATAAHSLVTVPSLFGLDDVRARKAGDGSAGIAGLAHEQEAEAIRAGRLRAEEVELFATLRAGLAWVGTHVEGAPRRYVLSLGEHGTVVLANLTPGDDDGWAAQHQAAHGNRTLIRDVGMEIAQGVAEDFARTLPVGALVDPDASWRKRPPSEKHRNAARKWRLDPDRYATAGELSDAITARAARPRRKAKPRT